MPRLDELITRQDKIQNKLSSLAGQKQALERVLADHEKSLTELQKLDVSYQKLQKFFQSMGTTEQERLQKWFEQVVSYGLDVVFGVHKYGFRITGPEVKANEIAIGFNIVEFVGDAEYSRDPYTEMGGGVCDVLSFLIQFVIIFLLRDRINPIIFIDEGFKHLAVEYRPAMAKLLGELVEKTPVQIVLVTHDPVFMEQADVAYEFSKPGKETVVERIK